MKGRELRRVLVERDGPLCHWCGRLTVDPLQIGDAADEAQTVDHLDTPKPRRSVRDPARAVLACSRCNGDRGRLAVDEWRAVLAVREGSAPRRSGGVGLYVGLAVAVVWWVPSIVVLLARPVLSRVSFSCRAKRAERLLEAGDIVEADRVISRLRWEAERCQRRVERRSPYSSTGDVDAS